MYRLFFFLFVLKALAANGGPVLQGQIIAEQGKVPRTLLIASFLHPKQADTVTVNSYGGFTYELKENVPALYRLQIDFTGYSVFVRPTEKIVRINITLKSGTITAAYAEDSDEDKAYKSFTKMLETFDIGIGQAIEHGMFDSLRVKIFQNFNAALTDFAATYKGTYAADSLLPLRRFALNKDGSMPTLKQFTNGFFSKINFKDTSLLATPIYGNMVDFFAKGLAGGMTPTEQREALSTLMAKTRVTPAFYRYTAERMFTSTIKGEEEEMSVAFTEWMMSKADSAKLPVLYAKVKALLPTMPGKKMRDVIAGKDTLSAIAANNKYTLLLFWEGECPYCRMVLPVVKKVYTEFHDKGFNVFSVTTDADTSGATEYLAQLKAGWVNVHIAGEGNSASVDYAVNQLPVMVLINQQGIIEKRFSSIIDIGDYLKKVLK